MKRIFTLLLILAGFQLSAQQYYNEWINYSQTYYKFKVGKAGLYRISKTVLDNAGLGSTPVENLELWRNGAKVPFYPSVSSGVLPSDGYVEFWGDLNDGKPDVPLYPNPAYQHSQQVSLQTDTSSYFLSVNSDQSGFIASDQTNDVASNTLPAEPYFMYTLWGNYKNRINYGQAAIVGEYVYSSQYDRGEFWASGDISPASGLSASNTSLYVYTGGPSTARLRVGAVGNALNARHLQISVNSTMVKDTVMDYFYDANTLTDIPVSLISTNSATLKFTNTSAVSTDRMCVSYYSLTYPRSFTFNGQKTFKFSLPAKSAGYYLEISNFSNGSVAPVLYDLTNGRRYIGNIAVSGKVRFALPALSSETQFVLASLETSNINSVTGLTTRNFVDYSNTAVQGDYLIISNPVLYNGSDGSNPVEQYKEYRASAAGGGHDPIVIDINQLVDQFAYGIKKHPLSIKNFLRYARNNFTKTPEYVFLIGHGVVYDEYRLNQSKADIEQLNLVPTFGTPASDNMLGSEDGASPITEIPIGRLSAINATEVSYYLQKVKEYEAAQQTAPNTLDGRKWMKNVVHVTGASDAYLGAVLCNYMDAYKDLIEDTAFGATVSTFCKNSTDPVEQFSSERIRNLFSTGITMLTYFGHSSTTTLEFNLEDPTAYDNQGKYPAFYVNGCNAGNLFSYYSERLLGVSTLSEKYVLAEEHGAIAFVASTHFGIVNYLNIYLNGLYNILGKSDYGSPMGKIQEDALRKLMTTTGSSDFYARTHAEEITLHGDPALILNSAPLPDYVIEEPSITINPSFISVAENSFTVKIKVNNLSKAVSDSLKITVTQQYPDNSTAVIFDEKIKGVMSEDSLTLQIPIVATRDKGQNRITVTLDPDNDIDEVSESNNTATKDVYIFEDEVRPVYPYDLAIVNDPTQKLFASTADPYSSSKEYVLEVDTTALFNSSSKISRTLTSVGGVIEFDPAISYQDGQVYYWRVASVPDEGSDYHWLDYSFIFMNGDEEGFNQSHFYQHTESGLERMLLDSTTHSWNYDLRNNYLYIKNTVYPTGSGQQAAFTIAVNGDAYIGPGCSANEVIFNVFDPVSFKPWKNAYTSTTGQYSSKASCGSQREYNFTYSFATAADRKKAMDFMDLIPDGYFVTVRSNSAYQDASSVFVNKWKDDTLTYGSENSLYHRLYLAGFSDLDSFYHARAFSFIYKKNDPAFSPQSKMTDGIYDQIDLLVDCYTPDTLGYVSSPVLGPASSWKKVLWQGTSEETPVVDKSSVDVIGVQSSGVETTLYTLSQATTNFDISSIDAEQYPYLRLKMRNADSLASTPYQLDYWRVYYVPSPEGAIAPNLLSIKEDTVELGEPLSFAVAFKNVSKHDFDSLAAKVIVLDKSNVQHTITVPKQKPLVAGDTLVLRFELETADYEGANTLFVNLNPDGEQPEQYLFNNFLYHNFYVRSDETSPMLDVTFDGVHILNQDIVSAKPHVQIKLTDDAEYLLLNDTSLSTVKIRYPNGNLRTYHFDNDTLRFTPATSSADNTAMIDFYPSFEDQTDASGDDYELIVTGKDASGNSSGTAEYRVSFKVISKPMISNLLNYPNPFSTSTAFVFTLTGSEVPQNMKIQILTVTGKIVREITKDELGPLHIGRNITEFKWDGTDQFGQKLGNGVYLYRFIATLDGQRMEKYKASGDNTDKYFNNGYGKMYLMR